MGQQRAIGLSASVKGLAKNRIYSESCIQVCDKQDFLSRTANRFQRHHADGPSQRRSADEANLQSLR
jgi:hypothetical protein